MNCPLILYPSGSLGTVQYYATCECMKVCDYTECQYLRNGFLVKFQAVGATTTDTLAIIGKKCGGSFPLVLASTGALATNAAITAGNVYTVIPTFSNGVLRGVIQGV